MSVLNVNCQIAIAQVDEVFKGFTLKSYASRLHLRNPNLRIAYLTTI
ncbi:MAG: hypothetical protein RMY16_08105 [Nostoc sp. DedQUE12b]|nr:hypothetical protein [Nostoc sp. DedQUE12b]MDZ8085546.1 hypothetical protein [Nostoc sp. DedQUE12b]